MSKKPMRECIECKKDRRIVGRGRCSGCYKRMMKQGLENDYKPKNQNAGMFIAGTIPTNKGSNLSEERKKHLSKINSGKNNPNYKHGKEICWYKQARKIIEKKLNRKLTNKEIVHHIDGDKTNNDIENLKIFDSQEYHMNYHWIRQKQNKIKGRMIKSKKVL